MLMFKREQFGKTYAQEKLGSLYGKVHFPESANIEQVNNELEKVIFSLQIHGAAPKYVLTRSLYPTVDGGDTLQSARFVVRPAVSHVLQVAELKKTFIIDAGEDFFDKFISELAQWFDVYHYHYQLQENVNALNSVVVEVIEENDIPFALQFSLGEGLLDASDKHAVVGLQAEVVERLAELPLFDTELVSRSEGYKARVVETLLECTKPYEIVKVKSSITKDLGIYSRRNLSKLMRQFVKRQVEFVRVGTGYVDTDTTFAVVDKVAVTEEELAQFNTEDALVVENKDASAKEKEAGKNKIVVSYRIAPFNKEEGSPVEVKLSEVI